MRMAGEHNALNATAAALAFGTGREQRSDLRRAGQLQEREAAAGSARGDSRHHGDRGLCASSHGDSRNAAGAAPSIRNRGCGQCLEPRSNTLRRKVLEADLVESLRLADHVVLAGVYQQERIPEAERLHPEDVVLALNAAGTPSRTLQGRRGFCHRHGWCAAPRTGDVVAILSNGGFDGIYEKLPARLRDRFQETQRTQERRQNTA
jgi:UDP-N-acetylmuramate: L-alanyl-gamma-D-glutamyl-meso-diaminopimelate ligase